MNILLIKPQYRWLLSFSLSEQSSDILGLALDPMNNILYWTTGYGHSILKANVDGHSDFRKRIVRTVHKFREEIPQGIAIDSCGRLVKFIFFN